MINDIICEWRKVALANGTSVQDAKNQPNSKLYECLNHCDGKNFSCDKFYEVKQ